MAGLSVICVYNSETILNDCLLAGLKIQKRQDYEVILIDNSDNRFTSAASALNHGARQATTDRFIFTHQDILMRSSGVLDAVNDFFDQGLSMFGSSGVRKYSPWMLSNVYTSNYDEHFYANSLCRRISVPEKVETLDECFVCITREAFDKVGGFDEKTCDNWHMYTVDLSITAKRRGIDVFAVPLDLFHASTGRISKAFIKSLRAVCRKHHLIWASTPCYHFFAFPPFMWGLYLFWQISYRLERK